MKLWPVEPMLNTFFYIFIIKIRFSSNQKIGEGESNFDDKYVEKSVQLVRGSSFRNDLLQNPYFSQNHETWNSTTDIAMPVIDVFRWELEPTVCADALVLLLGDGKTWIREVRLKL